MDKYYDDKPLLIDKIIEFFKQLCTHLEPEGSSYYISYSSIPFSHMRKGEYDILINEAFRDYVSLPYTGENDALDSFVTMLLPRWYEDGRGIHLEAHYRLSYSSSSKTVDLSIRLDEGAYFTRVKKDLEEVIRLAPTDILTCIERLHALKDELTARVQDFDDPRWLNLFGSYAVQVDTIEKVLSSFANNENYFHKIIVPFEQDTMTRLEKTFEDCNKNL